MWKKQIVGHRYFEEKNQQRIDWIHGHGDRRDRREEAEREAKEKETAERAFGKDQRATVKLVDRFLFGERKQSLSKRRPVLSGVNVGGLIGSGKVEGDGVDVEKGHTITFEDGA